MSSQSPPSPSEAPASSLDTLDELLGRVRRLFQRPGLRRRLLQCLSQEVDSSTLRVLRVAHRADEPPSVGTVAETLAVDPSTASRMVDRVCAAGYLERRACADDRRKARLHVTPQGRELLDEATTCRRALLAEVTEDWDADQLEQLIRLLGRLQEGFDRLERES